MKNNETMKNKKMKTKQQQLRVCFFIFLCCSFVFIVSFFFEIVEGVLPPFYMIYGLVNFKLE